MNIKHMEALAATFEPGERVYCPWEGWVTVMRVEGASVIAKADDGVELSISPYQLFDYAE